MAPPPPRHAHDDVHVDPAAAEAAHDAELLHVVDDWIADDPDDATAAELRELRDGLARGDREARAELEDRFSGTLQFGTAGLRGRLGGGPNRMNRAVVLRAAAGLAAFLADPATTDSGQRPARVVIGFDARHNSDVFARDTAAVMTAAGLEALLLPAPLPTPVLAFAVRHLGADAGVMVTASHNPPQDNGYKVYLGARAVEADGQGAQIVQPYDARIAAHIAAVGAVRSIARADDGWTVLGPEVHESYLEAVCALARPEPPRDLRIVLTPLHGVGGATVEAALRRAGYTDLHRVEDQWQPDPAFPTVAFPNPEEPGAIDLALGLAQSVDADLVVANDPDADRCAAAVRDPRARTHHGSGTAAQDGWRMLHGDEVGALLGDAVARRLTRDAAPGSGARGEVLASSIVSSRLLGRIAARHGLRHAQTLTGFKWIARVPGIGYGYEEALGYCVAPDVVRDKDGVSAALLLVQLADELKASGRTLLDALDDLARQHGLHLTDQLSARYADLAQIPATMHRVRSAPPTRLAGATVVEVTDLAAGSDEERGGLPPTDGLRLLTSDGSRVVIRPSGTEPKVKCYLEVVLPVEEHAPYETLTQAREAARSRLDALKSDLSAALGL